MCKKTVGGELSSAGLGDPLTCAFWLSGAGDNVLALEVFSRLHGSYLLPWIL